jgi:hypothetical protein
VIEGDEEDDAEDDDDDEMDSEDDGEYASVMLWLKDLVKGYTRSR